MFCEIVMLQERGVIDAQKPSKDSTVKPAIIILARASLSQISKLQAPSVTQCNRGGDTRTGCISVLIAL